VRSGERDVPETSKTVILFSDSGREHSGCDRRSAVGAVGLLGVVVAALADEGAQQPEYPFSTLCVRLEDALE
jgi:hypothetical protein